MPAVKVKVRRHVSYTVEHKGLELELEFEPVDGDEVLIREATNGNIVVGYLGDDPEPLNPRKDQDNFSVMVCWHGRYNLGDEHSYKSPDELWRELLGYEEYDAIEEKYAAEVNQWHKDHPNEGYGSNAHMKWINEMDRRQRAEVREKVLAKGYVILPLFLYDHSGITMNTGGFSDPWDSGQVGYIYAGPEEIKKNWSVPSLDTPVDYNDGKPPKPAKERAEDLMKAEVEEYDHYLTGECYGVCVEVFDAKGEKMEDDACWGYLGREYAEKEMKGQFEAEVKNQDRGE
jgi:hypothetical protein